MKKSTQVLKKKNLKTWKNNLKDKKAKSRNPNPKILVFMKKSSSSVPTLLVLIVKWQITKKLKSVSSSCTLNSLGSHRKKINSKKTSNCISLFRNHLRTKAMKLRHTTSNNSLRIWSKKMKNKFPHMKRLRKLRTMRNCWNLKVTQSDFKRQRSTCLKRKTWSSGDICCSLTS